MMNVTTPTPETGVQQAQTGDGVTHANPAKAITPDKPHQSTIDTKQESKKDTKQEVAEPILGFVVPESGIGKFLGKIGQEFQDYRTSAIKTFHPILVNHGSNLVGGIQWVGEILMFKAGGTEMFQGKKTLADGTKSKDYFHGSFQTWLEGKHPDLAAKSSTGISAKMLRAANPVLEPAFNIGKNLRNGLNFNVSGRDLLRPKFYKDTAISFVNLEKATEMAHAKMPGKALYNPFQTLATTMGLIGMGVAAVMPDDKDKPEDVQKLSEMYTLHPMQYIGHRITTALNPVNWWDNKRAFVGFMMTLVGASTFLAGFRNVDRNNKYFWNKAHGINGIITGVAGTQLILSPTAEQGWERWGSITWARMVFLPNSIGARYKKGDPNAHFYAGGQAAFQTGNLTSFLLGGAEVLPDGTIVDHKEVSKAARKKALAEKLEEKEEKKQLKEEQRLHKKHGSAETPPATHMVKGEDAANDPVYATTAENALSTAPEITTIAAPGSVIAANEAMLHSPEKTSGVAAA